MAFYKSSTIGISSGGGNYPAVAGTLTMISGTSPANLNLSTEGTLDWFCLGGSITEPWLATSTTHHEKVNGQMANTFRWVMANSNTQLGTYAGTALPVITTSGSDDTGDPIAGLTDGQSIFDPGALILNYGWTFNAPADENQQRVLRIYGGVYKGTVSITASLSDNSVTQATNYITDNSSTTYTQWTVTYKAARDGQKLNIAASITGRADTFTSTPFIAATLSTV